MPLYEKDFDRALIKHFNNIGQYLRANGITDEVQRLTLIRAAESWDKLSVDGTLDAELKSRLLVRPALWGQDATQKEKATGEEKKKAKPANPEVVASTQQIYKTEIKAINISQPDAMTCQSACIGMATGDSNVPGIRARLDELGTAGDPAVMGIVLKEKVGDRYQYNGKASLEEMKKYLRDGEFLIIHTFFTPSGHVISLDGLKDVQGSEDFFDAKDPWSEFSASSFAYNNSSVSFYDGYYSSRLIYAAAVHAFTFEQAFSTYKAGTMDSNEKGAWVHRILPEKKQ
jgi:hypothetical protein